MTSALTTHQSVPPPPRAPPRPLRTVAATVAVASLTSNRYEFPSNIGISMVVNAKKDLKKHEDAKLFTLT